MCVEGRGKNVLILCGVVWCDWDILCMSLSIFIISLRDWATLWRPFCSMMRSQVALAFITSSAPCGEFESFRARNRTEERLDWQTARRKSAKESYRGVHETCLYPWASSLLHQQWNQEEPSAALTPRKGKHQVQVPVFDLHMKITRNKTGSPMIGEIRVL